MVPSRVERLMFEPKPPLLLRPPSFAQGCAQIPLRHHPLHPRLTSIRLSFRHALPHRTQLLSRFPLVDPVEPIRRALHRPRMYRGRSASPRTAPAPLLRSFHEAGPHRIALHIPTDRQQILASFDGKGFEPPLIDVPVSYRVTMLMPPLRMGQREPVHEA